MINVADSLAAIRSIVFDEQIATGTELADVLRSDWHGERGATLRAACKTAPKYGNDDDYVDAIAADLYAFWAKEVTQHTTVYGGRFIAAAITIGTANWPGGAATGATPDGRVAGESLADESLTPMRGCNLRGIEATLRSASKIDQSQWQSLSLELRLHPDDLATEDRVEEVASMVRRYFDSGGKHIQFNVVARSTLQEAQSAPEQYRDLIVRIGGCSAYFTQLPTPVQCELTQHAAAAEGVLWGAAEKGPSTK
jgi:pyruvate-formate lyase